MKNTFLKISLLLSGLLIFFSCSKDESFTGSNTVVELTRELPYFDKIYVQDDIIVSINENSSQRVAIKTSDNLQDKIITEVSNNRLSVSLVNGNFRNSRFELNIEMPKLNQLEFTDDTSGKIEFQLDTLKIGLSDSSQLEIIGTAEILDVTLNDDAIIKGFSFATEFLTAQLIDDSELNISCISEITGTVRDESTLWYRGSPSINVTTSDEGRVIDAN